MKELRIALLTVMMLIASTVMVFADIVDPATRTASKLVPILIIVVAVIVVVLVVRHLRKRR